MSASNELQRQDERRLKTLLHEALSIADEYRMFDVSIDIGSALDKLDQPTSPSNGERASDG